MSNTSNMPSFLPRSESDLYSTGRLCELLQCLPSKIEAAASRAGVCPALTLNDVSYWSPETIETLRDHLGKK